MAWGITDITFVDNGTVSWSNPARQSLFTFKDALESRPKAEAARENMLNIIPDAVFISPFLKAGEDLKGGQ